MKKLENTNYIQELIESKVRVQENSGKLWWIFYNIFWLGMSVMGFMIGLIILGINLKQGLMIIIPSLLNIHLLLFYIYYLLTKWKSNL